MNKNNIVIKAKDLCKTYHLYDQPIDRLKEALNPFKKEYHKKFDALKGVSFEINMGDTIGVIGTNGSGKSTLLKILTGVLTPSSGVFKVNGRIAALLELGTGFNPDLNGIENIYFYGALQGFNRAQMDTKVEEIVAFADIGEHITQPLKTYSSGMVARLAFAAAITVEPEILIVDEALSVGDSKFQRKCMKKIEAFCETGTVIIVSHDTEVIKQFCNKVIWLNDGIVKKTGSAKEISELYTRFMYGDEDDVVVSERQDGSGEKDSYVPPKISDADFGGGAVDITGVSLQVNGNQASIVNSGAECIIGLKLQVKQLIEQPIIGFEVKDSLSRTVFSDNTSWMNLEQQPFMAGEQIYIEFKIPRWPNLKSAEYGLCVAIADGTFANNRQECFINEALTFKSIPTKITGAFFSDLDIEFNRKLIECS